MDTVENNDSWAKHYCCKSNTRNNCDGADSVTESRTRERYLGFYHGREQWNPVPMSTIKATIEM